MGPAGRRPAARPRRCGRSRRPAPRRPRGGARQQHLAGMGVRRARLGVQVVAVVPDRDQPEVVDRGERRGAGADHDPPGAPGHGEELAVAARRPRAGGQHDVVPCARAPRSARRRPGPRRGGRARTARCPARPRGSRPPPGPAAAASPPPAAPTRRPAASRRRPGGPGTPRPPGSGRHASAAASGSASGRLLGRGRPASRSSRAAEVRRAGARRRGCRRTARASRPASSATPGRSTGSALTTRRSGVSVPVWSVCGGARDDVAVEVLAGEPHLDPGAGHRGRRPSRPAPRSRTAGRGGPAGCRRAPGRPGRARRAAPSSGHRRRPRGAHGLPQTREGLGGVCSALGHGGCSTSRRRRSAAGRLLADHGGGHGRRRRRGRGGVEVIGGGGDAHRDPLPEVAVLDDVRRAGRARDGLSVGVPLDERRRVRRRPLARRPR